MGEDAQIAHIHKFCKSILSIFPSTTSLLAHDQHHVQEISCTNVTKKKQFALFPALSGIWVAIL
ncbi:MAG: hypothetical protein QG591_1370 [Planctomycetota bacterium]|jgi:hypothetical protein|nr:hypothetical protein [Planctomycetota bacterium]